MSVIDNDQPVSAYTTGVGDSQIADRTRYGRTEQTRRAVRHHRDRQRRGLYRRKIDLSDAQLNKLEERGYLDADRRGDAASTPMTVLSLGRLILLQMA